MTPKQVRFTEEYLVDLNGTKAAIRAGFSKKTARQQGQRLLTNVDIQEAIAVGMEERSKRTEVTADRVVTELAKLGFANAGEYFKWGPGGITLKDQEELTPDQQAAVAEVSQTITDKGGTIRLKLHDKRAALVDLGRHLGIFKDGIDLTVRYEDALKDLK